MGDSIDARGIPVGTPVVAGYGDGLFIWSPSWWDGSNGWDLHPDAVHLVIVVSAAHAGDILDVETGDATPEQVPGWVRAFNRPGRRRPTVYSARSTWPAIVAALEGAGLSAAAVDWWAATLDGTTDVAGAVAVQYRDLGPWDESVIRDLGWIGGGGEVATIDDVYAKVADIEGILIDPSGTHPETWLRQFLEGLKASSAAAVQAVKGELDALKAEVEAGGSVDAAAAIARIEQALRSA
jgi:hypothetical protein